MKNLILILLTVLLCDACATTDGFKDADFVFVGLKQSTSNGEDTYMSDAIIAATGGHCDTNFIHVGIIDVTNDTVFVIEATPQAGVVRRPLSVMLSEYDVNDNQEPVFQYMRLKQHHEPEVLEGFVANAKKYVGRGYDFRFSPGNEEQYCSELVYNVYILPSGKHVFAAKPMNFKSADGTYSSYWVNLFGALGDTIPQGVSGTNPNDMSHDDDIMVVYPR